MKQSILYALMCLVCIPHFVSAQKKLDPKKFPMCSVDTCKPPKKGKKQTCQCYCAAKGGPRDWVEGDLGYVPSQEEAEARGLPVICYCRQWDFDNAPVADEAEAERHQAEMQDKKPLGKNIKK